MKIAVGLVGTNGAGKSTACELLEEDGFVKISLSDFLRNIVEEKGLTLDRDTLTSEANKIKSEFGYAFLAKKAIEHAIENNLQKVIFDSVRHPDEVGFLKSKNVLFIGIDAPIELRFTRISSRMKETDQVDFETFKRQDDYERFGESKGQNIEAAFKQCVQIISNTDSREILRTKLLAVLGDLVNATPNC